MPTLATDDGVRLYYEEAGSGAPVVFVHEFGGDHRSWEPQLRHFGKRHRCVAFNARGYPHSDVPETASAYSQARAADDIASVLDMEVADVNNGLKRLRRKLEKLDKKHMPTSSRARP